MYFSGHIVLQRLVSPKLPPLPLNIWREFGLLENLQNLFLLSTAGIALLGALRGQGRRRRLGFALAAALATFIFLEEVDYGVQWAHYLRADQLDWFRPETEWPAELTEQSRVIEAFNLHTSGARFKSMKRAADIFVAVFFGLVPLVAARFRPGRLASWAPDRFMVFTVIAMAALRVMTHLLAFWEEQTVQRVLAAGGTPWELGSIRFNLSEFGELLVYYCFLLYVFGLMPKDSLVSRGPCGR